MYWQTCLASMAARALVGIPEDPFPAQLANLIDNLHRTRSGVREISAMNNQVRGRFPEIDQYCFECCKVSVYIRQNCDSHRSPLQRVAVSRESLIVS